MEKQHKGRDEYMETSPFSEGAVGIFNVLSYLRGREFSFGMNVENPN